MGKFVRLVAPLPTSCLLVAVACLVDAPWASGEDDPVALKLAEAKGAYLAAVEKARPLISKELDKVEDAARDRGDVDAVTRLKGQREAFEKDGEIPDFLPAREYRSQLLRARAPLARAYTEASRAYLKAGEDDKAQRLKEEWEQFQNGHGFAPVDVEAGWVPLFNGRDLSGWILDGENRMGWRVEQGAIVAVGENARSRNYLLSQREYADFHLRLEFNLDQNTNSAVAIRAQPGELMPNNGQQNFNYPILKLVGNPGREQTGTTHWILDGIDVSPNREARLNPPGSWNRLELEVRGRRIQASINGVQVLDAELPPTARLSDGSMPGLNRGWGRIGFQKNTGMVRFRNIMVKELKGPGDAIGKRE